MKETLLKKEFNPADVQRLRNLVTKKYGDATKIQVGYNKEQGDYKEGDIWEENSKTWTIKNGIKQTVTKLDKFKSYYTIPLVCPSCSGPLHSDSPAVKKLFSIHNMCPKCVATMETRLKAEGKYDEYEKNLMIKNKESMVDDFELAIGEWLSSKNDTFITEQGDVENWSGGKISEEEIKQIKEYIQKLRELEL
jgi:hypothetical protein